MKKKVAALIEVRKLVTLLFSLIFSYLAISGDLSAESVLAILTMVFGYYFGKSTALDKSDLKESDNLPKDGGKP